MCDQVLIFTFFSLVGCFLEKVWCFLKKGKGLPRRMLKTLPLCPVYGLGAVMFSLVLSSFEDNIFLLFIFSSLTASALELSYYLFFRIKYDVLVWNYFDKKINYEGGVCLEYTILWGFLGVFYIKEVKPIQDNILMSMPMYLKLLSGVFLIIIISGEVRDTLKILSDYKKGKTNKLPDYFWYMSKI